MPNSITLNRFYCGHHSFQHWSHNSRDDNIDSCSWCHRSVWKWMKLVWEVRPVRRLLVPARSGTQCMRKVLVHARPECIHRRLSLFRRKSMNANDASVACSAVVRCAFQVEPHQPSNGKLPRTSAHAIGPLVDIVRRSIASNLNRIEIVPVR